MKKADKYRDLSNVELDLQHVDLRKKLFQLKNEIKKTKKAEKPHLLSHTRKEIARLLTVKREKQLAIKS